MNESLASLRNYVRKHINAAGVRSPRNGSAYLPTDALSLPLNKVLHERKHRLLNDECLSPPSFTDTESIVKIL